MTDRPIIFPAPMVRALIDGRKTQTRRVLQPQPGDLDRPFQMDDGTWHVTDSRGGNMTPLPVRFAIGDRLWVRETWARASIAPIVETIDNPMVVYRAADNRTDYGGPWRSPIHMPRWASRLTLNVTDVRVQRLQDIRHADAQAEGAYPAAPHRAPQGGACDGDSSGFDDCFRCSFRRLWATIYGSKSWYDDVWVVALTFTVEQRNIDSGVDHDRSRGQKEALPHDAGQNGTADLRRGRRPRLVQCDRGGQPDRHAMG